MAIDPYASCPCGSGKKFKWCCQPIYANINRAFEQEAQGQHDVALRIMNEVTAEHGGNPEAWGQFLVDNHDLTQRAQQAGVTQLTQGVSAPIGLAPGWTAVGSAGSTTPFRSVMWASL